MTEYPRAIPQDPPFIPRYLTNQSNLLIFCGKLSLCYPIEITCFRQKELGNRAVAGELKSEGTSHDVIENKYRKNVTSLLSHDVDENTCGYRLDPTIFLKRNGVSTLAGEKIAPRKSPVSFAAEWSGSGWRAAFQPPVDPETCENNRPRTKCHAKKSTLL